MVCELNVDTVVSGEAAVKMANVATRGFKVDQKAWNAFPSRIVAMNDDSKHRYIQRISRILSEQREYFSIGEARCDSMASAEKLGLGVYTKKYVYVLDLSKCFNLALAKIADADLGVINELLGEVNEEYCRVLRLQSPLDLSSVVALTPDCVKYFADLARANKVLTADIVTTAILSALHEIMGYVFIAYQNFLRDEYGISIVLRSYTFFELIVTTDDRLDAVQRTLEISYNGGISRVDVRLQPEEIVFL